MSPEYEAYNAPYEEDGEPVYSLAKPFPRLVRRGMRPRSSTARQRQSVEARQRASTGQNRRGDPEVRRASHTGRTPDPRSSATVAHQDVPTSGDGELSQMSTHDFATESRPSNQLYPSRSEDEGINAGRQKLQDIADSQLGNNLTTEPTARLDWEEYYPEALPHAPTHRRSTHQDREFFNAWAKLRHRLREPLAEFLGTFIFMLFGLSATLASHLVPNPTSNNDNYGNFISTNLVWGWGSMVGIYVAGGISGAHLNPMISVILAIYRGFPWRQCWRYVIAQLLASFLAALIVYAVYADAIAVRTSEINRSSSTGDSTLAFDTFMNGSNTFYVTPKAEISSSTLFFTQFLATALFTCCVLAMGDDHNAPPGAGMNAFIIGLLVFVTATAFPYNSSSSLSPARDFGPRLVVLIIYREGKVFTERNWYWLWNCWIATFCGAISGATCYDLCIFTGGESPINYVEPGARIRDRYRALKSVGGQKDHEKAET